LTTPLTAAYKGQALTRDSDFDKSRFGRCAEARTFSFAPLISLPEWRGGARDRSSPAGTEKERNMVVKFLAEVLGTRAPILLGDGVVAGVLLAAPRSRRIRSPRAPIAATARDTT